MSTFVPNYMILTLQVLREMDVFTLDLKHGNRAHGK